MPDQPPSVMVNDSVDIWAPGMPSRSLHPIELGLATPSWCDWLRGLQLLRYGPQTDDNTQPNPRRPGCPSSSQDEGNVQQRLPIPQRPSFLPQSSHLCPTISQSNSSLYKEAASLPKDNSDLLGEGLMAEGEGLFFGDQEGEGGGVLNICAQDKGTTQLTLQNQIATPQKQNLISKNFVSLLLDCTTNGHGRAICTVCFIYTHECLCTSAYDTHYHDPHPATHMWYSRHQLYR